MDIPGFSVSLDQPCIPGHMGQDTKLDLRIIRINKNTAFLWHKYPAYLPSEFHTDGYILKIGFCTADAACSCNGLVKFAVDL